MNATTQSPRRECEVRGSKLFFLAAMASWRSLVVTIHSRCVPPIPYCWPDPAFAARPFTFADLILTSLPSPSMMPQKPILQRERVMRMPDEQSADEKSGKTRIVILGG